jgi:hypothetical protein
VAGTPPAPVAEPPVLLLPPPPVSEAPPDPMLPPPPAPDSPTPVAAPPSASPEMFSPLQSMTASGIVANTPKHTALKIDFFMGKFSLSIRLAGESKSLVAWAFESHGRLIFFCSLDDQDRNVINHQEPAIFTAID